MISYRKLAMRVLGHSPVSAVKTARRSTAKRAAALTLTAALVVGMTLPAFADTWYIDNGDISISAGENGNNVTQGSTTKENDTDTVIKSNDSSTASSNTVTIDAGEGQTVNVTLDNVNINTSKTGDAAVSVTGSGNTNIELNGNNTLTSVGWHAGLEHNKETDSEGNETSGTLTITDTDKNGSLAATGGNYGGAGIGGGNIEDAGKLEITGGTITATGGLDGAAIGSGASLPDKNGDVAPEADADITIEGKVTINATGGGDVAIGDSTNGETQFSGLQVGTTITRRNGKGDDVSQPGDVVREQAPTETEAAEAPSTGSVEVERPVTVEGLYVTNVLGKQITHTCTQNGTTLTIRANGIVASAHLTLGMVRTLKAQGVKTLVFTTLLSRSTTVSVDALLAAEPDAPDETAVVWTHTGPRAALTIGGADHSALLK